MAKNGSMKSVGGKVQSSTSSGSKGIPPGVRGAGGTGAPTKKGVQSDIPVGTTWAGQKSKPSKSGSSKAPLD